MSISWLGVSFPWALYEGYAQTAIPSAQFSQTPHFPYGVTCSLFPQSAFEISESVNHSSQMQLMT